MSDGTLNEIAGQTLARDFEDVRAPITFRRQPRAVEASRRVAYRIALLCLCISRFNQQAASLDSLHVVVAALRSRRSRAILLSWWQGRRSPHTSKVVHDPELALTLSLALANSVIAYRGNPASRRVALTDSGREIVNLIDADDSLLKPEKDFLSQLTSLSDASVKRNLAL